MNSSGTSMVGRLILGKVRPWESGGHHVVSPENPNSCLGLETRARIMQGRVKKEDKPLQKQELYVGINVAKANLFVAVHDTSQRWSFANDDDGISKAISRLLELAPALVVLEATGGLETTLVAGLRAAKLPTSVINPRRIRDFAKAVGKLAKTDALDSQVIARFAAAVRPEPGPVTDAHAHELGSVMARRRQVVEMLMAEENRLSTFEQASKTTYTNTHYLVGERTSWNQ